MKSMTFKNNGLTTLALLLALPTAYFILISLLKFTMGVDGPYDAAQPTLESLGLNQSIGLNVNLLILFGPVVAFFLTIFQVLQVEWSITRERFKFSFSIIKHRFPLLVSAFSLSLLAILFFYLLGENCNCK